MKNFLSPLSFDTADTVKCKSHWPDEFASALIICVPLFLLQPDGELKIDLPVSVSPFWITYGWHWGPRIHLSLVSSLFLVVLFLQLNYKHHENKDLMCLISVYSLQTKGLSKNIQW